MNLTKTYQTPLIITGLVTAIATYHYIRIFNSWVDAFDVKQAGDSYAVQLSGVPFNDAYRYVDWLLTVPLLLIELILVMRLPAGESAKLSWGLGASSAIMVALGYPGETKTTTMHAGSGGLARWCPFALLFWSWSWASTTPRRDSPPLPGARDQGAIPHGDLLVDVSG